MKATDGLFIKCPREEHENFANDLEYEEMIIDAACMRVVQDPTRFDVILCENFYGDLLSDLSAGLVGGIGVTPGANFGETCSVFEAVHGSAPIDKRSVSIDKQYIPTEFRQGRCLNMRCE